MNGISKSFIFMFGIVALVSMACFPGALVPTQPPFQRPTLDPNIAVQTVVASTLAALTQSAPTLVPTATAIPATSTPVPTATVTTPCDRIRFISDVTVQDGTRYEPGDTFVKTWRLQNRGTCTWTPAYQLVFYSGAQMSGPSAAQIPGNVAPGEVIDLSVTLKAPATEGRYVGYWMLRNGSGNLFGAGDNADRAFWVDIISNLEEAFGTAKGQICYPSEFIPAMTLYFENVKTAQVMQLAIPEGQSNYSIVLPRGTYYAYAYTPLSKLWGGYMWEDRTLRPFNVEGGQTTFKIKICNWGEPADYPH